MEKVQRLNYIKNKEIPEGGIKMQRKFRVAREIDLHSMKTSQIDSFFVGCVLGDGCVRKNGDFNFSNTSKPLVDYVENAIKNSTEFKTTRQMFEGKFRRGYQENDIYTVDTYSQKKYFLKIRKLIYDENGKRIITQKALDKLHLHSLAIWYMSDGSLSLMGRQSGNVHKRIPSIATHAFSKEDNEKIRYWFEHTLGIKATVNKQGKYYYLRFPVREAQKFFAMIFPYMLPEFYYKIDMAYPDNDRRIIDEYGEIYDVIKAYRSEDVSSLDMR